jgi:hypothetical protein
MDCTWKKNVAFCHIHISSLTYVIFHASFINTILPNILCAWFTFFPTIFWKLRLCLFESQVSIEGAPTQ